MNFKFKIGTKVFFGKECVKETKPYLKILAKELCCYGKELRKGKRSFFGRR